MSWEANEARRSSINSASTGPGNLPSALSKAAITRLLPTCARGALPASSPASSSAAASSSASPTTRLTRPHDSAVVRVDVASEQEQLACAGRADRVQEAAQARVRVDEPELGRGHAKPDALLGHAQVAGQRELEASADRVAGKQRQRGVGERLQRIDRFGERVGNQALRVLLEVLVGDLADVIAGGEHAVGTRDHQATALARRGIRRAVSRRSAGRRPRGDLAERCA